MTTLMQVFSRLFITWAIMEGVPGVSDGSTHFLSPYCGSGVRSGLLDLEGVQKPFGSHLKFHGHHFSVLYNKLGRSNTDYVVSSSLMQASESIGSLLTVFAWSLTEVIRYAYYFFSLVDAVPYVIVWCRYVHTRL